MSTHFEYQADIKYNSFSSAPQIDNDMALEERGASKVLVNLDNPTWFLIIETITFRDQPACSSSYKMVSEIDNQNYPHSILLNSPIDPSIIRLVKIQG